MVGLCTTWQDTEVGHDATWHDKDTTVGQGTTQPQTRWWDTARHVMDTMVGYGMLMTVGHSTTTYTNGVPGKYEMGRSSNIQDTWSTCDGAKKHSLAPWTDGTKLQ